MWGPLTWGGRPYMFSGKKLATFFGHHYHFYSFYSFTWVSPIISGMQEIAAQPPLVGPLFVGPLFGRTFHFISIYSSIKRELEQKHTIAEHA